MNTNTLGDCRNRTARLVHGALLTGVCALSFAAHAWQNFTFPEGENVGYWDDLARWSGDSGGDRHCYQPGTIYMTNNVGYVYQFAMHTTREQGGLTLHVTGTGSFTAGLYAGADASSWSYVQFDQGAIYGHGGIIGAEGYGVVTNYSTAFKFGEAATIGRDAGSYGELVIMDGAGFSCGPYVDKVLTIGKEGTGVFISKNTGRNTSWDNGTSPILLGDGAAGHGTLFIDENARFRGHTLYLGGRTAGGGGTGELVLNGGLYGNSADNGSHTILFYIGTCTNGNGEISATTYGVIRGWGSFVGDDGEDAGTYDENRSWERSVYAQIGRGEILGDGEGDESHVLDLSRGLCLITNVLFETTTTSGWRAKDKGCVLLQSQMAGNGDVESKAMNLGCAPDLETPDLVNAVRMSCSGMQLGSVKCFGMELLAADRSNAYTNALPAGCNVLSVHRLGVFGSRATYNPLAFSGASSVKIRYDQTKLSGQAGTRLELWRYTETSGEWTRLTRLRHGERPADLCISGEFTGAAAEDTYNFGTFAVVERPRTGFILSFR